MTRIPEQPQPDVPSVAQDELPDNTVLLDVREDDEYTAGRAPHSIHIPLSQVEARLAEIPTDQRIIVCCRSGGRSSRVVKFLIDEGYDAVNLDGGMLEWQLGNRPMKHDGPGIPSVQ